ncbi:MAG: hypothetical protein OXN17_05405 [Candidatus Poribacteria bacterium]|nr:hypothetical protein [Candidatus Poribacteria bacterium]MDE0503904.1 hypothetical protein [Candidatus Poribacteria bacterium]
MKFGFALTVALLLSPILFVGCYTQLGYDTAPRIATRGTNQIDKEKTSVEHEDDGDDQASEEHQTESDEDEGYYGRRKRTYDRFIPYYDGYHESELYPHHGYYSPYYSYYPYYSYDPYYRNYGYWNPYWYGRRSYRHNTPRYYKNRDFHHGKRRSLSHRGADSHRPSSDRPFQKMDSDSDGTSPIEENTRRRESRRFKRRH